MRDLKVHQKQQFTETNKLIWRVTKLLTQRKKMILYEFGLTCSQYDILAAMYHFSQNNGETIQINLSEKTLIDPMTTSLILRNLQKRNLIYRERSPVNGRTVVVKLTESGEGLFNLAQQKLDKAIAGLYRNLNQQLFASQLLKLSDKLSKENY